MGIKAELTSIFKLSNHAFNYYTLLSVYVLDTDTYQQSVSKIIPPIWSMFRVCSGNHKYSFAQFLPSTPSYTHVYSYYKR